MQSKLDIIKEYEADEQAQKFHKAEDAFIAAKGKYDEARQKSCAETAYNRII